MDADSSPVVFSQHPVKGSVKSDLKNDSVAMKRRSRW
jgi:hypothetical protein